MTPERQNMTKPEAVTQEDRDLVVSFYSSSHATFWPDNFSKAMETCDEIKRGHCDNWELVQAVASHRQAAEQRGAERERERCLREAEDADPLGKDAFGMREYIAQAIRQGEQA